jgi:hypothetical protein
MQNINTVKTVLVFFCIAIFCLCDNMKKKNIFQNDVEFLKKHKETIVLKNNSDKSQIAIVPAYQGRVMTSTSNGLTGQSYGWLNYELISSEKLQAQINVFGGEDRFWLGFEGGQYSIFFRKGDDFTIENWQTPKGIDTEPFIIESQTDSSVTFTKKMSLINYQDCQFNI